MISRRNLLLTVPAVAGVVATTLPAFAKEPEADGKLQASHKRLIGKWKSDLKRSIDFNDEHGNLKKEARDVMRQLLGTTTFVYDADSYVVESPAQRITGVTGKVVELDASRERRPYEVLGATDEQVAIKHEGAFGEEIRILHFEDGCFWIYVELNHTREYFERID